MPVLEREADMEKIRHPIKTSPRLRSPEKRQKACSAGYWSAIQIRYQKAGKTVHEHTLFLVKSSSSTNRSINQSIIFWCGDFFAELHIGEQVDLLAVQSKLEQVAFKTEMEGNYYRNPFTEHGLKPQSSTAVIQSLMEANGSFRSSRRELPHGRGTLKTVTGDFIYSGDWRRGSVRLLLSPGLIIIK